MTDEFTPSLLGVPPAVRWILKGLKAITSKYYNTLNCYFIYCFFIMHYAFIIMPSNTLIMYCMGFTESVTKIIMPCNYITCLWSSVSITW